MGGHNDGYNHYIHYMNRYIQLGVLPLSLGVYWMGEKRVRQKGQAVKTFLWGDGVYQARPDATMNFSNFRPKLIDNWR